eukprot:1147323-Pyramimonas_sp.AAC.1
MSTDHLPHAWDPPGWGRGKAGRDSIGKDWPSLKLAPGTIPRRSFDLSEERRGFVQGFNGSSAFADAMAPHNTQQIIGTSDSTTLAQCNLCPGPAPP